MTGAGSPGRVDRGLLEVEHGRSPTLMAFRRLLHSQTAVAGLGITVALVLVGLLAPWISPHEYWKISVDAVQRPPGTPGHFLGTDELGRDVLSRLVFGASLSLQLGIGATVVALVVGVVVGAVSGYVGGWIDAVLQRVTDTFMALPTLLVAISLTAIVGGKPSLTMLFLVMGFLSWPTVARVVRGQILSLRENDYAVAARSLGAGGGRILFLHLLPNCIGPVVVLGTLLVAGMILFEAGLSFLGLGVQPPYPSWGRMLLDARPYMAESPWLMVYPGAAIVLTVLGLNFFGDGLRDAFDPKMKV